MKHLGAGDMLEGRLVERWRPRRLAIRMKRPLADGPLRR
jgi:hypothetical protein